MSFTPQNMGTSYVLYAEYELQEPDPFMKALNDTGMAPTMARMRPVRLPVVGWTAGGLPQVVRRGGMYSAEAAADLSGGELGRFLGLVVVDKMQEALDIVPHVVPLVVRLLEARRGAQEPAKKRRRGKRVSA